MYTSSKNLFQLTTTMLEGFFEACHTCAVGSCGYTSRLSLVAQQNHHDCYLPCCTTVLGHKIQAFSPMLLQVQNRGKWYDIHHKPSQWASRRSHGRCNLAWITSSNTILVECISKLPLEVVSIGCTSIVLFMWIHVNATYVHPMCIWFGSQSPCEHGLIHFTECILHQLCIDFDVDSCERYDVHPMCTNPVHGAMLTWLYTFHWVHIDPLMFDTCTSSCQQIQH